MMTHMETKSPSPSANGSLRKDKGWWEEYFLENGRRNEKKNVYFAAFLSQACYRSSFPAGRGVNNSHVYQHLAEAPPNSPHCWPQVQSFSQPTEHWGLVSEQKETNKSVNGPEIFCVCQGEICLQHFSEWDVPTRIMTLQSSGWSHRGTIHLFTLIPASVPGEAARAAAWIFQQHLLLLLSEESLGGLSAGHKSSGALITLGKWRNALREKSPLDYYRMVWKALWDDVNLWLWDGRESWLMYESWKIPLLIEWMRCIDVRQWSSKVSQLWLMSQRCILKFNFKKLVWS